MFSSGGDKTIRKRTMGDPSLQIASVRFAGILALVVMTATMATTSIITPQLAFAVTSYTVIDKETCEALPSVLKTGGTTSWDSANNNCILSGEHLIRSGTTLTFGSNQEPITPIRWTLAEGSTLNVAGTLNNLNGEIDGTAVRFDNYGTVNVKKSGVINNYDYFINHNKINNAGTINIDFSGIVNFGTILNKGTINLKNGGAIYLGSNGEPIFPDLPGTMINAGKVNIDSTSGFALTNSKSVLTNTGIIDNSNILRIKSGTLNNSGEINNKPGATIQNSAVINNRNHGVINNSGSITNFQGVDGTINEYCGSILNNNQGEGTVTGNTIVDKCK